MILCRVFQNFLFVSSKTVKSVLSLSAPRSFGFVLKPAKSIPFTHFLINSNMCFQVYMRDFLFRYFISNLSSNGE
jgi:hypothetical protein